MRRAILTAVAAGLVAVPLAARGVSGASISGSYVEARTAEVFAGGCIMNGEAATTGKEALLAWKVDQRTKRIDRRWRSSSESGKSVYHW